MDSGLLQSVFNHVPFPPKLPGSCDYNVAEIEEDLIERTLDAIETLARLTCDTDNPLWEVLKDCLVTCQAIHMDGFLNQDSLLGALNQIEETPVILHIVEQNAGLIIEHELKTGILESPVWCEPLSEALQRTRWGKTYQLAPNRSSSVIVGTEFTKVTSKATHKWRVDFLRPVHWILWIPRAQKAVVIIPEEAELLTPIISNINPPNVYLIVYAALITKEMLRFNNLDYYTIPKYDGVIPLQVKIEIGLLAGHLYIELDEYQDIMQYLEHQEDHPIQPHSTDTFPRMKKPSCSLLTFLEQWFSAMRKGQDLTHTPMGYICQGRSLRSDHPFFTKFTRFHARSGSVMVDTAGSDGPNVDPFDEESDKFENFPDENDDGIIEMVDGH